MFPKFRAWHKEDKRYYDVETIYFSSSQATLYIENKKQSHKWCVGFENIILEQYTNIYDIDLVRICVGDIVRHYRKEQEDYIDIEVRSIASFSVYLHEQNIKPIFLKVIGNIHEGIKDD